MIPENLAPTAPLKYRIRNAVFTTILFLSSFFGSLFMLFPFLPLLFYKRRLWRLIVDRIVGLWLCLPVAMMEYLLGMKFTVTGDRMHSNDKAVIIMNHRTRLDWMFLWSALYRMDKMLLTSEKIILKSSLRHILGAGWAMECDNFVFLERSWERDASVLSDSARYHASLNIPYQTLIFPEGTDLCHNSLVKSDAYAKANNLAQYRQVLHPRTSGLLHMLKEMLERNSVEFIYDITVAYPDEIVQTEIDLVTTGRCPGHVEFHCRRYKIADLLSSQTDSSQNQKSLSKWCEELWSRKEIALTKYYDGRCGDNDNNNVLKEGQSLAGLVEESINSGSGDITRDIPSQYDLDSFGTAVLVAALSYWLVAIVFWLWSLYWLWWLKYFAIVGVATFKIIERKYGGVERLEILMWRNETTESIN